MKQYVLAIVAALGFCAVGCAPDFEARVHHHPQTFSVDEEPAVDESDIEQTEQPEQPDGDKSFPWARLLRKYQPDPYSLDHLSREAVRNERGRLQCPELELESYRGETVKYHKPLKVNVDFRARLKRFEDIVDRVATDFYGRPPRSIVHYGTYNCRTIRHRKYRLSEHALGNAIDVAGFRFAALPREERADAGRLGRSFTVDVLKHWEATEGDAAHHAAFMKTLVKELRKDAVFRGMIVPPAPGHKNHLHLDMGRWSYLRGDVSIPTDDVM